LQKEDFTLLDDKQPKNIVSFHAVDSAVDPTTGAAVGIVLLADEVNVSYQTAIYERD
jgi:hypothetical protein